MATFEDSFLADIDELSDNEPHSFIADLDEFSDNEPQLEENDAPKEEEEEDEKEETEEDETTFSYDYLDSVFKIQKTQEFTDIMQKVEEALDFDSAFKELVDCNNLLVKMEEEFAILHSFFRQNNRLKHPKVQWFVPHATKYARVVKTFHKIDTAAASNMFENVQEKTIEVCDRVLDLNSSKKKVVKFVDMKARLIAPNLSVLVGGKVATKLMVSAGGLSELAEMPPTCNVTRVGNKRKRSFVGSVKGFLMETDIVKNTPPRYQDDACDLLAANLTLAAVVDSNRVDCNRRYYSSGAHGRALRDEVLEKLDKLQGRPKRGAVSSGTTFLERMSKEQSSPQSLELGEDDETQSKYFSKFGTFSKINKSNLAGDEDYYMF
ncbi:PREDICTED: U4/U6 small nuclear ribonucleoprotein Prp31-like [Camelina sativa]|uniref:U4/U6 small nuclear ribonucleoprotein Prp31-like n=1 Tax=Camelina sativa TaxID=90675 RepID=A0ABM0WAE4_CAMSA|nr:PREDICTED: U4/U6 small nuclear ribonucleoprotein Prp31-like [Camelina sativa]